MVKELFYEKNEETFLKTYSRIEKYENISDRMEIEIANYLTEVSEGRLSSESKEEIRIMLRAVSEIESIADSCNNLARMYQTQKRVQIRIHGGAKQALGSYVRAGIRGVKSHEPNFA